VLGLDRWGTTRPPKARSLGSILAPMDAEQGLAFTSMSSSRLFHCRRKQGWGLDPVRCQAYLTSSQGLMLNLLGPLTEDLAWAARTFDGILDRGISDVLSIEIEYAPVRPSMYINDKTRIDALVVYRRRIESRPRLAVIEIKLADRWSSRYLDPTTGARRDASRELGYWLTDRPELTEASVNQLFRCHLLASMMVQEWGCIDQPRLSVIHLGVDSRSECVVQTYKRCLDAPELANSTTLEEIICSMSMAARSTKNRAAAELLRTRYCDLYLSDND
jgi:hypothetical protein